MTYSDFLKDIKEALITDGIDLSSADVKSIVTTVFGTVKTIAESDDNVKIPGFGTFKLKHVKERSARDGINPATKEAIKISAKPAYDILAFKASKK
jgi:DNA-binding protein HU-beta